MGMIQKQGNWVPMNWNRETLKGDFSFANSWFKDNREKIFCIGLWLEMRNRYSTTPKKKKYYSKSGQSLPSTWTSTLRPNIRRSCSGETKRVLFLWAAETWWFYYQVIGIGYNWFVWACIEKNGRNTSKDMIKLFFFMTTLGLSLKS